MRTTLELDEKLVREVVKFSGEKNKGKAVNKALAEYVRRHKIEELRKMLGTIGLADTWREDEERELEDMRRMTQ
jgi:Arc/MetJ family transcription regulator